MNNFFRETGIPSSVQTYSTDADNDMVENPGAGKAVVIVDVSATGAASFRDVSAAAWLASGGAGQTSNNSGDIVLHVGAGSSNFSSPIQLGENKGLSLDATGVKVTVNYYVKDL